MAKILIVEDEVLIANHIKINLEKSGYFCCGHATSYEEAVELVEKEKPDLLLLDIRLYGSKTGIDLAQFINTYYQIPFIYLTSHFEKTTLEEARNTRPAGYLTKPYQPDTLVTTIEICLFNHLQADKKSNKIEIWEGKKKHEFREEEIYFIQADHVYTHIILSDRSLIIRKSLNEIVETLSNKLFMRVHKSFVINIRHIQQINSTYIHIKDNKIPIGRTFKKDVLEVIGSHTGKSF